jgi:phosphoglycerate dehydrogenase-like enzyme
MPTAKPIIVIPADEPPQLQGSPHLDRLHAIGEVRLWTDRPADDAEKVRRAAEADCLINSRSAIKWPGTVLRRLPRLRMITVVGIGTDAIDLEAARQQGIVVSNLPGRTAPIVAEHAFGLMLAVAKRAWYQTSEMKQGRWQRCDNVYLRGKMLGVIGAGPIAQEMAALGRAISMRVQAWTFQPSAERAAQLGLKFVELDDLLRTSDVVSLHLPLSERTRGFLGKREFQLLKPGALFINTARGAVIDNAALAAELNSGRLGGAGIDVFETEPPPPDHPLLACEQVVLTPHIADQTPEGMELLNAGAVDNVLAFLEGKPRFRVV